MFINVTAGNCEIITDSEGKTIHFARPFTRIISLYPAHTENLLYLGAKSQLIGISVSDDKNEETAIIQRFSYRDNPERFIAAKPDLVLIRPMISRAYPGLLRQLERAGITYISLQPQNIDQIYSYWAKLGKISGREQEAATMTAFFRQELKNIQSRIAQISEEDRPVVYFEAIHSKTRTFAPSATAAFCLKQAGGSNIAADAVPRFQTNIADYGKEKLLAKGNQIDVFLAQQGRMNPVSIKLIKSEPGFTAIKAVRENKIYLIDEKLVSRPTIKLLEAIKIINGHLYK
ncbi:MAG: peptide ABC transporter substrate-binding protein [Deltaproteobacteria bacterium]|nr:MAG: peptide ABC transporter substrate-binding protein [Deltaproteobacteria bacterium]